MKIMELDIFILEKLREFAEPFNIREDLGYSALN